MAKSKPIEILRGWNIYELRTLIKPDKGADFEDVQYQAETPILDQRLKGADLEKLRDAVEATSLSFASVGDHTIRLMHDRGNPRDIKADIFDAAHRPIPGNHKLPWDGMGRHHVKSLLESVGIEAEPSELDAIVALCRVAPAVGKAKTQ
jgi:hypothetical protein